MNHAEVVSKNQAQITESLHKAASTNKVIHDICFVFAMRDRTRFQVNVGPLRLAMARAGYHLTVKEIEEALVFFASLGIGKLAYDNKKRLKGLVEVRWTLQSIGKTALGEDQKVTRSHQQRRYQAMLPATTVSKVLAKSFESLPPKTAVTVPLKSEPKTKPTAVKHQIYLSAAISGREVKFQIPMRLTSDELMELIAEMNEAGGVNAILSNTKARGH